MQLIIPPQHITLQQTSYYSLPFFRSGVHSRKPNGVLCRVIIFHRHLDAVLLYFSVLVSAMKIGNANASGLGIEYHLAFSVPHERKKAASCCHFSPNQLFHRYNIIINRLPPSLQLHLTPRINLSHFLCQLLCHILCNICSIINTNQLRILFHHSCNHLQSN